MKLYAVILKQPRNCLQKSNNTNKLCKPILLPIGLRPKQAFKHCLSNIPKPYFGDFFYSILDAYYPIHGYLSLLVCIFGIFANILNIVVLTR